MAYHSSSQLQPTLRSFFGQSRLEDQSRFTVQKSHNQPGSVGIFGLFGLLRINNLRIINTP